MATVGVAAVAALEVVSRGEDHVRTFVVKILGAELVALVLYALFSRCVLVEFDWLRHWLRPSLGFDIDAPWNRHAIPLLLLSNSCGLTGYPPPPIARA